MLGLGVENQPNGPLANLRGKLVRGLAHDAPSYARVGASGKPGAVHSAYVLARQLVGDHGLVASLIASQTVAACVLVPLVLATGVIGV